MRATALVDACAHATGQGARGEIVAAADNLGALPGDTVAYDRGRRSAHAMRARCQRVAGGVPLEDPVGEGTRRSTAPRRSYLSVPQRQAQYAERCLRQGRSIRRAVRVTNSSTPSDATSPAVRQQLNDLHPSAAPPPFLEEEEAALQLSLEQFQAAVAAIAAHHRGSAAGPSGWTLEMICTACQSSDAATLAVLGVVNLILSGELPRETFLLDSNLIGLDKPDGGVRPIAIGEAWYRFAGICALRECGRDIGAGLAPLQLGVGTRGGTETVVHALSSALAEGHAVFAIDMRNAFNTVSRQAILEAVKERAAPLLPMVQWAYGRPTALHIVGAPPGTPPVMSETGVRQGDPLGPLLFALALQPVLQRVAGGCPDAPSPGVWWPARRRFGGCASLLTASAASAWSRGWTSAASTAAVPPRPPRQRLISASKTCHEA